MSSPLPTLHICNTFFETELLSKKILPLSSWMRAHPAVRKLQTLPLLYAEPEDFVLISDPSIQDPRLKLIDSPLPPCRIEDWGASPAIQAWAEKNNHIYSMPDWQTVKTIHSKLFSHAHSKSLPGSALLLSEKEALLWIEKTPGPKVLKAPIAAAGQGHFHLEVGKDPSAFFKKYSFPLLGEPWVERVLDFSTQWENGNLLGATLLESGPKGSYRATRVGPNLFKTRDWALEEHLEEVKPVLREIKTLGYFGPLGIDAFIYKENGKETLRPIVEINARKTMGYVALKASRGHPARLAFTPATGVSLTLR